MICKSCCQAADNKTEHKECYGCDCQHKKGNYVSGK